jgi:riboflavin kinase / FMN adenylyltransferase
MIQFTTTTTHGHGRGKTLGFPTINMVIPSELLNAKKGIHASRVSINSTTYQGALYFGPPITFGDIDDQLEVYLLDIESINVTEATVITVSVSAYIRGVQAFKSKEALVEQMERDVSEIRNVLNGMLPQ